MRVLLLGRRVGPGGEAASYLGLADVSSSKVYLTVLCAGDKLGTDSGSWRCEAS